MFTVLDEYGLRPDPDGTDADLDDIERSYFARGGTFRILQEEDGSLVGAYGLYPLQNHTCELRKMYLRRTHRGRGLGRRLLEDALASARELGFTTVTLETASVLKEAIALYKRYGFVPCPSDHLATRCDQAYILVLQ
ncbi:GNAT family N-acetyltransferase [Sedimentisphaerales bacterium M17dextr]|uniref:GNAT family N-acetyltransferase n=1 Tax=Anaerobaca lacustris TaxID=3044600 RepID=A0AAW6TZ76_9BACT|nr:GNAT family N-acetyltransferase [Sedimentisphaerales bacterium M17dextr]